MGEKSKREGCCNSTDVRIMLACSGASNVGQITNDVAKELDAAGEARFFCLAGVGGHVSGMIASVKGADRVVVLDGCPVACGKKTMDAAGLADYHHLVVTELGIEKKHDFNIPRAEMKKAKAAVRGMLAAPRAK